MSDELRRALAEAASAPPPVGDWLTPVRSGVLRRRRRRALQAGAGVSALVVAGVLGGLALLPSPGPAEVLLPPPTPTAAPTRTAAPSPASSPAPAPRTTPLPADLPAELTAELPLGLDDPGPITAGAPASRVPEDLGRGAPSRPRPSAGPVAPAPAASAPASPRPSSRPTRSPTPSPTATAGAQDITLSWTPTDRTVPAGREFEVVVTARGSAERPPFVQALRVDGEPVEQDAPRSCTPPRARPERSPQQAVRRFTVVLPPGDHVLEAVADDDCSWYRGRARDSWTVTAS